MTTREIQTRRIIFIDHSYIEINKDNTGVFVGRLANQLLTLFNKYNIPGNIERYMFIRTTVKNHKSGNPVTNYITVL